MAVQHGIPGEWARVRGTVLSLWPLFLSFILLGAFAAAALLGRATFLFAGLFLASLVFMSLSWRRGVRRVASFFVGARGEERVAGVLATLPETYHVFHDFVADGHPVDHVVLGPAGVFAIETKNWRGKVTVEDGHVLVDGHLADRSPLQQTLREGDAVQRELEKAGWKGSVQPVLCFASDTFGAGHAVVGRVELVNARDLAGWVQTLPEALAPNELERLIQLVSVH